MTAHESDRGEDETESTIIDNDDFDDASGNNNYYHNQVDF